MLVLVFAWDLLTVRKDIEDQKILSLIQVSTPVFHTGKN